ncbi:MAG: hypothetical protein HC860_10325 [Alkalinema sp. RU_4_3]|nr:hypothetical protein [Alkalinema sp. RU_4_3]
MQLNALLQQLADQETQLRSHPILAPCLKGGFIRTRIQGLIYEFTPKPRDFEGWGLFYPLDAQSAMLSQEAEIWQIDEYLRRLPKLRLRLVYPLKNQTWLAYPVNEGDMRQRFGTVRPIAIHLVSHSAAFEVVIARKIGATYWFETTDRKADPAYTEALQKGIQTLIPPSELKFSGLTPEMRSVYELVVQRTAGFPSSDEKRLRDALKTGGGQLDRFQDGGDFWTVHWRTGNGEEHTSAICKRDLTVMTAGICLDGLDRDFDLQSLVGVVEQQEYD